MPEGNADASMDGNRASPRVQTVVLNWNNARETIGSLHSITSLDYPANSILLIDNGSTDDSVKKIRDAFPRLHIIETSRNLGVAAGRNVGIDWVLRQDGKDAAKPSYVLFLDNDVTVDTSLLSEMMRVIQPDPSIGAVTPKIYYRDNPDRIWAAGGMVRLSQCLIDLRGLGEPDGRQFDERCDVDYAIGCASLIPVRVLKEVGGYDPAFGVYAAEEVDWCLRARSMGYRIVYAPHARMWHRVSKTTPGGNYWYQKVRNNLTVMKRHATPAQWASFIALLPFLVIRAVLYQVRKGTVRNIPHMVRAALSRHKG